MTDLPLTKLAETASTITLGWTPIPCLGYVLYADGVRKSNSWDQAKSSWKTAKAGEIRVVALGAAATGVWPPVAPPPPGTVIDCWPGEWAAKLVVAKPGDTIMLHGVHGKLTVDRAFPTDNRLTVACAADGLVKGGRQAVEFVSNYNGYVFQDFRATILAVDTPNLDDIGVRTISFNGSATAGNVRFRRCQLQGGYGTWYPYSSAGRCVNLELLDSDISLAWGDLVHAQNCNGLTIDHCVLHDLQHLTAEHHDAFQPESVDGFQFTRNHVYWTSGPGHYTGKTAAYLGQGIMVSGNAGTPPSVRNGVIGNNLIERYNGRPLNIQGAAGLLVYNNTLLDSGDGVSITFGGGTSGIEVWNNLVESCWQEGPAPVFYGSQWLAGPSGSNIHGNPEWTGDPGLDAAYKPVTGSPVRGKGVERAGQPAVDLDGVSRPAVPGLGAYI